ncbi:hypothetical protein CROQUDRAFT_651089 [Cronartium quercuum f. sp. fusiforme G11]|uniref:Prenyltransferase alpha-alpha toroid domain-containing protein n=1 Tax=Cronartium quercuum f. sp. fusiforme G11 TaxID=708437 RepID=A0A9P6NWV3_9BASI|nr:hypothetical protein CROQUDRAFT_651089 [Cronartium quercuum f. sp. fusiforme G11]
MPVHPLLPTPTDDYRSDTSVIQSTTEQAILDLLLPWVQPHLIRPNTIQLTQADTDKGNDENQRVPQQPGSRPISTAVLDRTAHMKYLIPGLNHLAPRFTGLDASRPWLMYWILNSFSILNLGLNTADRQRAIDTVLSFQHPQGGFGGGPGHLAHLAPTFSSISTLVSLLGAADDELVRDTWARVDIGQMYNWMLTLKQPDGSFIMQQNGEVDVRATYCALCVASLLNFLTPDLARGLPEFIAGCQTYEGGLGSASQLVNISTRSHRIPLGEAHGGYTSCGLLSHFLIKSLEGSLPVVPLDYPACLRWLSLMQALPIEGGGFRGRTNKLVDGCYSWWCGGVFPVINALIAESPSSTLDEPLSDEIRLGTYDRQGLQEYILLISQGQPPGPVPGGLRDKPSAPVDHYHTHYVLSGLSSAQHQHYFSTSEMDSLGTAFDLRSAPPTFIGIEETLGQATARARAVYSRALAWLTLEHDQLVIGAAQNGLIPIHPVFNMRTPYVKRAMDHFYLAPP